MLLSAALGGSFGAVARPAATYPSLASLTNFRIHAHAFYTHWSYVPYLISYFLSDGGLGLGFGSHFLYYTLYGLHMYV